MQQLNGRKTDSRPVWQIKYIIYTTTVLKITNGRSHLGNMPAPLFLELLAKQNQLYEGD